MSTAKGIKVTLHINLIRDDGPPASFDSIVQAIDEYIDGATLEVEDPEREEESLYSVSVTKTEWTV